MTDQPVALISGGSRGLGKGLTKDLMKHGYIVATFSRSETDFVKQMKEADPNEERFFWRAVNAKDSAALKSFATAVYKRYRRIDALVNNAGSNLDQLLAVTSDDEISNILSLNLEAVTHLTRQVVRVMLKQSSGSIVNVSSIIGHRGFKGTSVYAATKAGLDGFTRGLARELGGRGIRVNSLSPGFLETDMTTHMPEGQRAQIIRRTPMGRLGFVEDVVGLVRFLIGPESTFLTGQAIVVDGGLTC